MKTITKKTYNEPQMEVVMMKNNIVLMAGSPSVGADVNGRTPEDVGYPDD